MLLSLNLSGQSISSSLGLGGVIPPQLPSIFRERIADGAGYTWHFDPVLTYDSNRSRYYLIASMSKQYDPYGNISAAGEQALIEWDANTGEYLGKTLLTTGAAIDDHNCGASLIIDGRLMIAYTQHGADSLVRLRRSSDSNPANLGPEVTLEIGGPSSYIQFSVIGSTIYLITQEGDQTWKVYRNTQGGEPNDWVFVRNIVLFSEQGYCSTRAVGTDIAVIMWSHPVNSTGRGPIRAGLVNPETGTITFSSAPIIYTPPLGLSTRVLSVNDDCTQIAFVQFTPSTHTGQTYRLARLTGSDRSSAASWTFTDLGQDTNASFYENSHYVSGVTLKGSGATATEAYVGYSTTTGGHAMEHWYRALPTDPWIKTTIATSQNSTGVSRFLARPVVSQGDVRDFMVMQEIFSYPTFYNYELRSYPVINKQPVYPMGVTRLGARLNTENSRLVVDVQNIAYFAVPDIAVWNPEFNLSDALPDDVVVFDLMCLGTPSLPTSVVIGGVTATQVVTSTNSTRRVSIYSLVVPPEGLSGGVNVTWSATQSYQQAQLSIVRGISSATPVTTRIETQSTPAGTFAFNENDFVSFVGMSYAGSTATFTAQPNVLQTFNDVSASTKLVFGAGEMGLATQTDFRLSLSGSSGGLAAWAVFR